MKGTDWHNFGMNFSKCPLGEHTLTSTLSSMDTVEKFMVSDQYRESLEQYILEIEKDYTWH